MKTKDIIHQRRLELGLTLEDVAKFVGVSKPTVLRWESGDIENMRRDKIARLAECLQVSPLTIMESEDSIGHSELVVPEHYRDVMVAFQDGADKLTQDDIDDVIKFIEFLKDKRK